MFHVLIGNAHIFCNRWRWKIVKYIFYALLAAKAVLDCCILDLMRVLWEANKSCHQAAAASHDSCPRGEAGGWSVARPPLAGCSGARPPLASGPRPRAHWAASLCGASRRTGPPAHWRGAGASSCWLEPWFGGDIIQSFSELYLSFALWWMRWCPGFGADLINFANCNLPPNPSQYEHYQKLHHIF